MDYKERLKSILNAENGEKYSNSDSSFLKSLRDKVKKSENPYLSVDEDYINSFVDRYRQYATDAQKDNIDYNYAISNYENKKSEAVKLQEQADNIRNYYYANRSNIKDDSYKSMMSYLDSFDDNLNDIINYYDNNYNYYSQWESKDDYDNYMKSVETEKRWSTLDLDASKKEFL